MLLSLPAYNNTAMQLRKQRFGWRMEDHARQSFRFQICSLLSPITTRHNMAYLGLAGSARFGQWLGALGNALDVLAPNGGWLAMAPLLSSLRQDTDAFDQVFWTWALFLTVSFRVSSSTMKAVGVCYTAPHPTRALRFSAPTFAIAC